MEAIYDPSNTDRILTKYSISVQTVITADYIGLLLPSLVVPDGFQLSVVAAMQLIQQKLLAPRKALSLKFNGVEMMPAKQQGVTGTVDASNGPRPLKCELIPMDGATNTTFILLYSIEASYWISNSNQSITDPNKNLPGNVVLYNRWSEGVNIDGENRTVRTRKGKILIRSDNIKGWIADYARASMAVVSLPPGRFLRKRSSYVVDENGLGLAYEVVDQEVFRMPTPPSFKAEGEYAEQGTRGDGKRFLSFRVKLWGDNETSQVSLIKTCAALCIVKLNSRGAGLFSGKTGLTIGSNLRVGAYENWAEYRLIALQTTTPARINTVNAGAVAQGAVIGGATGGVFGGAGFGIPGAVIGGLGGAVIGAVIGGATGGNTGASAGVTPGVMAPNQNAAWLPDVPYTPNYLIRGTAGLLIQAARYYDPSFQATQMGPGQTTAGNGTVFPNDVQLNTGRAVGEAGKQPE